MRKTGRMQIESRVEAEIRLEGWSDMDLTEIKFTSMPLGVLALSHPFIQMKLSKRRRPMTK